MILRADGGPDARSDAASNSSLQTVATDQVDTTALRWPSAPRGTQKAMCALRRDGTRATVYAPMRRSSLGRAVNILQVSTNSEVRRLRSFCKQRWQSTRSLANASNEAGRALCGIHL